MNLLTFFERLWGWMGLQYGVFEGETPKDNQLVAFGIFSHDLG
jgi:hypothetical protein